VRLRKRHCAVCFEVFFPTKLRQSVCKRCRDNKVRNPKNNRVQNFKKVEDAEMKKFHKNIETELMGGFE